MKLLSVAEAMGNTKKNAYRTWNRAKDASTRSEDPTDASTRIHDRYADVRVDYRGPTFTLDAPVFTMGSCFAREIESALVRRGGNIVSIDQTIDDPVFDVSSGTRTGFFHRYTPTSMAQEFRWPFGEQPGWSEDALLLGGGDSWKDLNYGRACTAVDEASVRTRRRLAGQLVRNCATAKIIIITLGLTESWKHLPTGLAVNALDARALRTNPEEFALELLGYEEVMTALEKILALIQQQHATGDFQLFVTVSPVPFQSTFSDQDVIVANMTSKSTLRAAADAFVSRRERCHYFPSYELVMYSDPALAWRPDQVHVQPGMVRHIMDTFIGAVFESPVAARAVND
jgi:hypothetical protein